MNASVTLDLNNAPFEQRLKNSERSALTFGSRLKNVLGGSGAGPWDEFVKGGKKAEGAWGGFINLFGKQHSPERRAERALSPLLAALASGGNLSSAVIAFSSRISGLGLAIGVGVGASLEIFEKLHTQIKENDKASRALGVSLATLGGVRGPEEVSKKFEEIAGQTQELIKTTDKVGPKISSFLDRYVNPLVGTPSRGVGTGQDAQITSGMQAQAKLLEERNKSEFANVMLREESVRVGAKEAEIDKVKLDLARRQTSIREELTKYKLSFFDPAIKDKVDPAERDRLISKATEAARIQGAIANRQAAFETSEIKRKYAAKQQEYDLELKIANLGKAESKGQVDPGSAKNLRTAFELKDINARLKTATPDEKQALQIRKIQKENELRGSTEDPRNKFAYGTMASRQWEEEHGGFGSIFGRNKATDSAEVYGSLGYNAAQRGESKLPEQQSAEIAASLKELVTITAEAWKSK